MFYHANSTYIKACNQALKDQKPIKKVQKSPKPGKTIQKMKIFHKNMYKRVYDLPTPHLNLTMFWLGVEESHQSWKHTNNTKQNT